MNKTGETAPVPREEGIRRVLLVLDGQPTLASGIGQLIWPNNRMRAQGLARSAGPFINAMLAAKQIRYIHDERGRGYIAVKKL